MTTREPRTEGFDCSECGQFVEPTAYHPYTYCVLHRAGVSIQQARNDLGAAPPPAEAVEALRELLRLWLEVWEEGKDDAGVEGLDLDGRTRLALAASPEPACARCGQSGHTLLECLNKATGLNLHHIEQPDAALRAALLRYLATDGHHGMWDAMEFSKANADLVDLMGGEAVIRAEEDRIVAAPLATPPAEEKP